MVIVIANAPLVYRQALAAEVRARRPYDEVLVADPQDLEEVLRQRTADAVISADDPPTATKLDWLVLYPDRQNAARLRLSGARFDIPAPDLQLVLAFLTLAAGRG